MSMQTSFHTDDDERIQWEVRYFGTFTVLEINAGGDAVKFFVPAKAATDWSNMLEDISYAMLDSSLYVGSGPLESSEGTGGAIR